MHRARYRLCLGQYTGPIANALKAELSQPAPQKGRVSISVEGGCLIVEVESPTISGLRALSSSFLYLIHAAYSSLVNTEQA